MGGGVRLHRGPGSQEIICREAMSTAELHDAPGTSEMIEGGVRIL